MGIFSIFKKKGDEVTERAGKVLGQGIDKTSDKVFRARKQFYINNYYKDLSEVKFKILRLADNQVVREEEIKDIIPLLDFALSKLSKLKRA